MTDQYFSLIFIYSRRSGIFFKFCKLVRLVFSSFFLNQNGVASSKNWNLIPLPTTR